MSILRGFQMAMAAAALMGAMPPSGSDTPRPTGSRTKQAKVMKENPAGSKYRNRKKRGKRLFRA